MKDKSSYNADSCTKDMKGTSQLMKTSGKRGHDFSERIRDEKRKIPGREGTAASRTGAVL